MRALWQGKLTALSAVVRQYGDRFFARLQMFLRSNVLSLRTFLGVFNGAQFSLSECFSQLANVACICAPIQFAAKRSVDDKATLRLQATSLRLILASARAQRDLTSSCLTRLNVTTVTLNEMICELRFVE